MMKSRMFPVALVCAFILFQNKEVVSQQSVIVSGAIVDSLTGQPLPFAQISVQHCTSGTVSNDEGWFNLEIQAGTGKDTILIAFMGYETRRYGLNSSGGNPIRIALVPGTFQLSEIEIVALTPTEVLRRVVRNIPVNYGKDPLILTAFIRSTKFVRDRLAEYTEAIIEDLKSGYTLYDRRDEKKRSMGTNIPLLLKGRVISDTGLVNSLGDLGSSAGCLGCNFIHDYAEFYYNTVLDEKLFPCYAFKMEEVAGDEGGKLYHIWFDQKKGVKETLWKGEIFINGTDFALLRITQKPSFQAYEQFEKQKYRNSYIVCNSPGWYQEMPMMERTTTYASRNGNYYLNTIRNENWLTFKHPATGQTVKFAHKNEVVVTDATRDPEKIRNFTGDKSTGVNQRWDQIVGKEDVQFWSGYNYLPIEKKLLESLNKLVNR